MNCVELNIFNNMNDYERWDFWNRETENMDKSEVLERFYHKISKQKDLDTEFNKLVNDNFFKLVEDED
jgi:hypothetical protein